MCLHLIRINWISLSYFAICNKLRVLWHQRKCATVYRAHWTMCFALFPTFSLDVSEAINMRKKKINETNKHFPKKSILAFRLITTTNTFVFIASVGKCFLHISSTLFHSACRPRHDYVGNSHSNNKSVWFNGVTNKISVSYEVTRRTIMTFFAFWKRNFKRFHERNFSVNAIRKNIRKVTGFCW